MTDPLFLAELTGAEPGSLVAVTGDEGRHAAVVKRIQNGEQVLLADGAGAAVRGTVVEVDKHGITVRVQDLLASARQAHRWVGVQALAKGDRSDLAVETMTELGVDEVVAWQAARSIVRWSGDKATKGLAKWQSTAREAAKQSRRFRVPQVTTATTRQLCQRISAADLALVLHEAAEQDLADVELPAAGEVLFVVGPEGGITPDELAAFQQAGARAVLVSDAVLRTSTAGVVALAQLQLMARLQLQAQQVRGSDEQGERG